MDPFTMFYIWLGVLVLSVVIEFIVPEMVSIWFGAGSLFGIILAACSVPIIYQVIAFIVVAILCILLLRKICLKYLTKNSQKTNIDENIGKKVKLLSPITFDICGTIKLHDTIWEVITEDGTEINKDQVVEIIKIKGNKFIVKGEEK